MTLTRERPFRFDWRPFAIMAASVACVASTALVVDGYKATHKPLRTILDAPHTITARGSATRHVVPDRVHWEMTVSVHGADAREARRRAIGLAEKARAFLIDHDVRANEITLQPTAVEEATRRVVHHRSDGSEEQDDVPNGFDGTQTLSVASTDISRIFGAFHLATSSLELDGVEMEHPSCTYSGLAAIEDQLLPDARLAVRQRAEATVKTVGRSRLGRLVAIEPGSFSTAAFNDAPLASCEHGADVAVTIDATFELK
jgi:hypothetical protein